MQRWAGGGFTSFSISRRVHLPPHRAGVRDRFQHHGRRRKRLSAGAQPRRPSLGGRRPVVSRPRPRPPEPADGSARDDGSRRVSRLSRVECWSQRRAVRQPSGFGRAVQQPESGHSGGPLGRRGRRASVGGEGPLHTSTTAVTGAFTASILVGAVMAVPVGRWLDRHGAERL